MPRGLNLTLQGVGIDKTADDLELISDRMRDSRLAFLQVIPVLESGEERHFRSLRGKYVDTGALRDSLTQGTANGAIREAHGDQLIFGTSLHYARFLRKKKKSAVLVLKPTEKKLASELILGHIMRGVGV